MGPYDGPEMTTLARTMNRLAAYRRKNPEVIITPPSQTLSHLWEVSMPGASAMAFDTVERLLDALPPVDSRNLVKNNLR